ncbi:MAG: hypothetical protein ACD_79C00090G0014 [uncultured bacterium]|nr:MAG: hypothetical protein ACD_79C00090G0014 [uncultured bacterium]
MKILVTGALGTVGRVLVNELRIRNFDVWMADLSHYYDPKYIKCDVSSIGQLRRIFDENKFDYVFHLAAEFGRWNGEDYYDTLWRTNVIGTKNLIRFQEKLKFRMIFFSSSEVYGDFDGVMKEEVMDKYEIKQLNDYAMTKWVSEMQIINSRQMFNTETVRVRLFNTYGPGELYSPYRSVICRFIYCALMDIPYTVFLNHHRTSSYVLDTVKTLANICERFNPGAVYNIGGKEYHDIKMLSDIILKYLNKSDKIVTYVQGEPFTTKDKKVDVSKAEMELNHYPTVPLEEGIPKTIEWMKKTYLDSSLKF